MEMQKTIAESVNISGIGIHSGKSVDIQLMPANLNTGITFKSQNNQSIKAIFENVHCTNMSTKLSSGNFSVDVVEHLMAAIWSLGIDNLIIQVNSVEIPILDGSSIQFIDIIRKIGLKTQSATRKTLVVKQPIEITDADKYVRILPNSNEGIIIEMSIDFQHQVIGKQQIIFDSTKNSFINEFAFARTFGFTKDIEYLHSNGLALGASLNNCIGLTDTAVANPEGLRCSDEFVRHKVLDCVGDLFLSGYYMNCIVIAHKTGHTLNNLALRELFENQNNYIIYE